MIITCVTWNTLTYECSRCVDTRATMVTRWKTTNCAVIDVSTAIFPSPSLWAATTILSKGICLTCCCSITWIRVTMINKLAYRTWIKKTLFDMWVRNLSKYLTHNYQNKAPPFQPISTLFNWFFVYKKCKYEYSTYRGFCRCQWSCYAVTCVY